MSEYDDESPVLMDDEDVARNDYRLASRHFLREIDSALSFIIESENKTLAAYSIALAFGRSHITDGRSQQEISSMLGVTRAAVSRTVKQVQSRFGSSITGIEPMPGQRSLVSCRKFSSIKKQKWPLK